MRHKAKLYFPCLKDFEFEMLSDHFNFQKLLLVLVIDFFAINF